ncbi:hypothetical protein [Rudaea sp.]|uniref:YncE family protein n=1 Tax=Rudaea sp. TaxID=2136325 RepID=UPI002ED286D9
MIRIATLFLALAAAVSAQAAETAKKIYAQELVDRAVAARPDVAAIEIHATPPKTIDNVVIAAYNGHLGEKADAEDLDVIRTGKTSTGVNKAGDRYEVNLPLFDVAHRTVGSIGIAYKYKAGDDKAGLDRSATEIRDHLSRRISHVANLMENDPIDPAVPTNTLAQNLVDEALDADKGILIIAMHAAAPSNPEYPIIASNIGRIGKAADEDDMGVIKSGKPKLELNESGDRFESLGVLRDAGGKLVGAVGVVFPYKKGDDQQAMHQRAEKVRAVMATRIEGADSLVRPAAAQVLTAAGGTELPGYEGDFDHFAVDIKGNRLFLAAEDHNTLEVFELSSLKHLKTIDGLETPHGLLYLPDANKLIVTQTGSDGLTKVIDGASYKIVGSFKHTKGADPMGYDASRKRLYVVAGGRDMKETSTWLVEIDPYTGRNLGELKFATDKIEAMAIEEHGNKIFINVTGKKEMAVVDKNTLKVIATWPIKTEGDNAPLAFDEATHRLFVITRKPGTLIVVNADTGAQIAELKAPERCDQVIFDKRSKRIYALGGDGHTGVFVEKDADHVEPLQTVTTVAGAKTGILVPKLNKLFVAASPGDTKATAAVLAYDVK